jgi:hypothetical protein
MLYSFRAECWLDVLGFIALARGEIVLAYQDRQYPDVEVEFESDMDLGTLKAMTDLVEDAHVIRETMRARPLSQNDLTREYGG